MFSNSLPVRSIVCPSGDHGDKAASTDVQIELVASIANHTVLNSHSHRLMVWQLEITETPAADAMCVQP